MNTRVAIFCILLSIPNVASTHPIPMKNAITRYIAYTVQIMVVTLLPVNGNSSKFHVEANHGEFVVALSYTLRTKIWKLADDEAELTAAKELAEAIVSRHDPALPFKKLYIFAEHNTYSLFNETVQRIRKNGMDG